MYIERLWVRRFRNLTDVELELAPGFVELHGDNGQGKTNVLEAIYVCASGRSFRLAKPQEMLQYGTEKAEISCLFSQGGVRHEIEIRLFPKERELIFDGRKLESLTRLFGKLPMVAFFPDDLRICKGSPEDRRRFFDRLVANSESEFIHAALSYHRVLKTRNTLLKQAPLDTAVLASYDEQLIAQGSVMHKLRSITLQAILPRFKKFFYHLRGAAKEAHLELVSGVPPSPAVFAEAFRQALLQRFKLDCLRGQTHVGPHRADLRLYLGDKDARLYASQGEQRAMVLALKLAELQYLRELQGEAPLLILDDVASELDGTTLLQLFGENIEMPEQVLCTHTRPLDYGAPVQRFRVEQGALAQETVTEARIHTTSFR